MNVELEIPDELGRELAGSPEALRRRVALDLAVFYYGVGNVVSLGRATELSGLTRGEFEAVLMERGIERNYSGDDLKADLEWANEESSRGNAALDG